MMMMMMMMMIMLLMTMGGHCDEVRGVTLPFCDLMSFEGHEVTCRCSPPKISTPSSPSLVISTNLQRLTVENCKEVDISRTLTSLPHLLSLTLTGVGEIKASKTGEIKRTLNLLKLLIEKSSIPVFSGDLFNGRLQQNASITILNSKINIITSHAFSGVPSLYRLQIKDSYIGYIQRNAFGTGGLRVDKVEMSRCVVGEIESVGVWIGWTGLLHIDYSKINRLAQGGIRVNQAYYLYVTRSTLLQYHPGGIRGRVLEGAVLDLNVIDPVANLQYVFNPATGPNFLSPLSDHSTASSFQFSPAKHPASSHIHTPSPANLAFAYNSPLQPLSTPTPLQYPANTSVIHSKHYQSPATNSDPVSPLPGISTPSPFLPNPANPVFDSATSVFHSPSPLPSVPTSAPVSFLPVEIPASPATPYTPPPSPVTPAYSPTGYPPSLTSVSASVTPFTPVPHSTAPYITPAPSLLTTPARSPLPAFSNLENKKHASYNTVKNNPFSVVGGGLYDRKQVSSVFPGHSYRYVRELREQLVSYPSGTYFDPSTHLYVRDHYENEVSNAAVSLYDREQEENISFLFSSHPDATFSQRRNHLGCGNTNRFHERERMVSSAYSDLYGREQHDGVVSSVHGDTEAREHGINVVSSEHNGLYQGKQYGNSETTSRNHAYSDFYAREHDGVVSSAQRDTEARKHGINVVSSERSGFMKESKKITAKPLCTAENMESFLVHGETQRRENTVSMWFLVNAVVFMKESKKITVITAKEASETTTAGLSST
ncbi:uncharacterized protein LOC123509087 [Portunus trituberculatus]|uniref:uncharacterized protein LOC123509087 n=1 Tax=Portunus trituberculatus TaxID=210409 RepID=UPI001E1CFD84|nr:uncharacterized protein LOC123509087 [Portunus trituberculatus]